MKYFTIYTVIATGAFVLGLFNQQASLTDALMIFVAHLCGCFAASAFWLCGQSVDANRKADQMQTLLDQSPQP